MTNFTHGPDRLLRQRLQRESSDGARVLANPDDNPICSIVVDPALEAIVITWRQYATSLQMRFIHEHLLEVLATSGLHKMLGDDTCFAAMHQEEQVWISQQWMPRAIALGLRAVASKNSVSYFGRLAIHDVLSAAPKELTVRIFDDLVAARRWLKEVF